MFTQRNEKPGNRDARRFPVRRAGVCALVGVMMGAMLAVSAAAATDSYRLVDLRAGTAKDGQTFPSVGTPFAMTGWTPETRSTEQKCIAPYYDTDKKLTGFRGSHFLSGSCAQEYGSVTLMPMVGAVKVSPDARASSFRHASEVMSPASYSVLLDDYQTKVELTATTRTSMFRISFPRDKQAHLLIQPNAKPGEGYVEVRVAQHEVVGYNPVHRIYQGDGLSAGFNGYFVARFQTEINTHGTWCGDKVTAGGTMHATGCQHLGAYVSFDAATVNQPVLVKVGTSFTSLEEAEKNLDAEDPGWDFDHVRVATEAAWKTLLGRIEVEGGSASQRSIFYTALYHASLDPRIVSDADGSYNGFASEGKIHRARNGGDEYDDFSVWDTFRGLHPMLTILDPAREQQMVQSLIDKGEQGGFLPIFPLWNNYTSEMVGDHTVAIIFDAYAKGLRDFDVATAYKLVRRSATTVPPHDDYVLGKGRRALDSYMQYGFIPLEDKVVNAFHHQEQVSRTLEYAYDDSVVAKFAEALGRTEDAQQFRLRSGNWKNVFDPSTGFVRGRYRDGKWFEPFDPRKPYPFITEGIPWQYTFFVPQDIPGLAKAMGGDGAFIQKLDGLFDAGLYEQGNEPSHAIAYLYDYAGAPWKTQMRVRDVLDTKFHEGAGGLPGNDDSGQMSAWYVLSAMGFYPVQPGTPTYALSSPIFSKVMIHEENGKQFTILAPNASEGNRYIQSASLDGQELHRAEITHAEIVAGSTLVLKMGPKAATSALK